MKSFEEFLDERLELDTYRGHHIFQHERYEITDVQVILKKMFEICGFNTIEIRTKDISKCPDSVSWPIYANFCSSLEIILNKKNLEDSIRKIYFVDFERMGLIKRYRNGRTITSVSLTEEGYKFAFSNKLDARIYWAKLINNMFEKEFLSQITRLLEQVDYITLEEYTYFVSGLDYYENLSCTLYDIATYIIQSRKRKYDFIKYVTNLEIKFKELNKNVHSKTGKRDIHNWKNQSATVFKRLSQSIYFNADKLELRLVESIAVNGSTEIAFKRSAKISNEYNQLHKIENNSYFDYHHIIPLFMATCLEEKILLDSVENIICIDANTHALFTRKYKNNIKFNTQNNLSLVDPFVEKEPIILTEYNSKINKNVLYEILIPNNESLLNNIFKIN